MKNQCFGAAGCVIKNNKILLILRTGNFVVWEFPAGGIEFGENPEETAVREVREEVNLKVKSSGLLAIGSYVTSQKKHEIFFYYKCKILKGKVKIGDRDHSDYKWFTYDEIKKLPNLALSVKCILNDLRKVI